jgi:hypothetical protein
LVLLVLVVTFSIVRGDFSILMPFHSGFAAKNWFLHIQCATMFTIMLLPVVIVFGFTRTDNVLLWNFEYTGLQKSWNASRFSDS